MPFPFNDRVKDYVYRAVADDSGDPGVSDGNGGYVADKLLAALAKLEPGQRLASSPLVKVMDVDDDSVRFLIRGEMKFMEGFFNPFVRIEAVVSKTVLSQPEVPTFIADLRFVEGDLLPVVDVHMGLGYDGTVFLGEGKGTIIPVKFALDVFIGGLSSSGFMIGIDMQLPWPAPIAPPGLGFHGLGGDVAHNFKPRLEAGLLEGPILNLQTGESEDEPPTAITNPTAADYVLWARSHALDRWVEAPIKEHAGGIGVRAYFCDVFTAGGILAIDPLGFAGLMPGPVIILGGTGKLIHIDAFVLEAYAVIDIASRSFAFGGSAELKVGESGDVMEATGFFDSFFSFRDPKTWFITLGTPDEPNEVRFLAEFTAKSYLELNHYHFAFGAGVDWLDEHDLAQILHIFIQLEVKIEALLGWNPRELAGAVDIAGEAGFRFFKLKLSAMLEAHVRGHLPQPKILEAVLRCVINLPFPLFDTVIRIRAPHQVVDIAPEINVPTLRSKAGDVESGAEHAISGRQWNLPEPDEDPRNLPWPDAQLVVPFSRRVTDATGKVLSPPVSSENNGGYEVTHRLERLQLFDEASGEQIEGVQAVWAEAPDGDTAQLRVLGGDPYAWLFSNELMWSSLSPPEPAIYLQKFGLGDDVAFGAMRRFGELNVTPSPQATLSNELDAYLPERTLVASGLDVAFRTATGEAIPVDRIRLYIVGHGAIGAQFTAVKLVTALTGSVLPTAKQLVKLAESLYLTICEFQPPAPIEQLTIAGNSEVPFHLYAVGYREMRVPLPACGEQVILQPGRYRLSLAGTTTAHSVDGLSDPDPQDWGLDQPFQVIYPPSVRPYIKYATVGDSRLFGKEALAWNPTPFGMGFPAYRYYLPVVRFLVPYMSKIFPVIRFQLIYEGEQDPALEFSAAPEPNTAGENSLLDPGKNWAESVGCTVAPDEALRIPDALPKAGPALVRLRFDPPGGDTVNLDRWTCYVSRFGDFGEHLALKLTRLKVIYTADGVHFPPPCFTPPGGLGLSVVSLGGNHLDSDPADLAAAPPPAGNPEPLLPDAYPIASLPGFPDELGEPPLDWRLPGHLAHHLDDDQVPVPVSFARFAADTGAVFSEGPAGPLFGINNTVAETTVEAVADGQGRLYALWLRTPEPVDWRRVRLSLHVWHLVGSGSCATRYAHRKPLKLSVEALPGPDASSAFLVGSLADIRTRLPRGEYTLTLSFHPHESGLPRLEKSVAVGGTPEVVNLKFVHFDGPNWPLPSQDVSLPAGAAEALVSLLDLPPQAIAELLAADTGSAAARQALVARLKGAGRAAPRPVGSGGRLRRPKTV